VRNYLMNRSETERLGKNICWLAHAPMRIGT
jgi:hypothetical protein